MKEKLREKILIIREIVKNMIMGNRLLKDFRGKITSGRTTGALNVDEALDHSLSIFEQYQLGLADAGFSNSFIEKKSILEIGPGSNLGVQLSFISEGARRAYALDRFEDVQSTSKETALYDRIVFRLNEEKRKKCSEAYRSKSDFPVFTDDKIKYIGNCSIEEALSEFTDESGKITMEFDLIVSHLALEHIADINKGIYSIAELMKPGGICIFICNLGSLGGVYKHEEERLRLLYYPEKLWRRMFSERGGSNRVRAQEYKELLEKNDFSILSFNILERMPLAEVIKIKPYFDEQFKKYSDDELSILKFRIVARKK